MSSLFERIIASWIDIEDGDSPQYDDGAPLDAEIAMILASNEAHLAHKSRRHYVWDGGGTFSHDSGKNTWDGVTDAASPSPANISAIPPDEGYKTVSWIGTKFVRRWGRFFPVYDRVGEDGRFYARGIRFEFRFNNVGGTDVFAHLVVTTHRDPLRIAQGAVVAYAHQDLTGSGAQLWTGTITPMLEDGYVDTLPARAGGTNVGPVQIGLRPVYIWLCVDSQNTTMLSASLFEAEVS